MNKRELIARVQRHMGAGASRDAARAAVNAVLESIIHTAKETAKVHIARLGTFEYREHRARCGKGLATAAHRATTEPSRTRRLHFRPARHLKTQTATANGPQAKHTSPSRSLAPSPTP